MSKPTTIKPEAPALSVEVAKHFADIRKAVNGLDKAKGGIWRAVVAIVLAGIDDPTFRATLKAQGIPSGTMRPYMSAAYGAHAIGKLDADTSVANARAAVKGAKAPATAVGEGAGEGEGEGEGDVVTRPSFVFDGVDPADFAVDGVITRESVIAWATAQMAADKAAKGAHRVAKGTVRKLKGEATPA